MLAMVALLAPFQNIAPPRIEGRRTHVVRHEIEDEAEPGIPQCEGELLEACHPADGRINLVEVRHVVAMG
jgi:hypothetical protein